MASPHKKLLGVSGFSNNLNGDRGLAEPLGLSLRECSELRGGLARDSWELRSWDRNAEFSRVTL